MKLTIDRPKLLAGLARVQGIVERRGTLPILANALIEARQDEIKLAATDLEVGFVASIEAQVESEGSVTLGAKKLHEIVWELDESEVALSTEDGSRVGIDCGPGPLLPAHDRTRGVPDHPRRRGGQLRFPWRQPCWPR